MTIFFNETSIRQNIIEVSKIFEYKSNQNGVKRAVTEYRSIYYNTVLSSRHLLVQIQQ